MLAQGIHLNHEPHVLMEHNFIQKRLYIYSSLIGPPAMNISDLSFILLALTHYWLQTPVQELCCLTRIQEESGHPVDIS